MCVSPSSSVEADFSKQRSYDFCLVRLLGKRRNGEVGFHYIVDPPLNNKSLRGNLLPSHPESQTVEVDNSYFETITYYNRDFQQYAITNLSYFQPIDEVKGFTNIYWPQIIQLRIWCRTSWKDYVFGIRSWTEYLTTVFCFRVLADLEEFWIVAMELPVGLSTSLHRILDAKFAPPRPLILTFQYEMWHGVSSVMNKVEDTNWAHIYRCENHACARDADGCAGYSDRYIPVSARDCTPKLVLTSRWPQQSVCTRKTKAETGLTYNIVSPFKPTTSILSTVDWWLELYMWTGGLRISAICFA